MPIRCISVAFLSRIKQRLLPYTAKADGFHNRDEVCLLRGANWMFKYNSGLISVSNGRVIVQMVSRRPLIAKAWIRSEVSPCGICGERSGTGKGIPPSTSFFLCQRHSTHSPPSSSSTCCSYQKDKRVKPGNLAQRSALLGTEHHQI